MVETQGKQNRRCPVLLTKAMTVALDCLMKHREGCGISSSNPYVFASPTSASNHIDPWTSMNKLAKEAGCEQLYLISSSRLRKYLATVCQILDLEEWVSRHLAHNINTHKQHYRQHDATAEIVKVGSLMMQRCRWGATTKICRKEIVWHRCNRLVSVSYNLVTKVISTYKSYVASVSKIKQ